MLREDGFHRKKTSTNLSTHLSASEEKKIETLGKIELNVTFGEGNTQRTEIITFDVVDITYPYNAIFGRNSIIKFAAVINQAFLCMKIPMAGGVITILGNQEEARRCEDNAACAMKNVHAVEADNNDSEDEETKPLSPGQHDKDRVMPAEHTKKFGSAKMSQIEQ